MAVLNVLHCQKLLYYIFIPKMQVSGSFPNVFFYIIF